MSSNSFFVMKAPSKVEKEDNGRYREVVTLMDEFCFTFDRLVSVLNNTVGDIKNLGLLTQTTIKSFINDTSSQLNIIVFEDNKKSSNSINSLQLVIADNYINIIGYLRPDIIRNILERTKRILKHLQELNLNKNTIDSNKSPTPSTSTSTDVAQTPSTTPTPTATPTSTTTGTAIESTIYKSFY